MGERSRRREEGLAARLDAVREENDRQACAGQYGLDAAASLMGLAAAALTFVVRESERGSPFVPARPALAGLPRAVVVVVWWFSWLSCHRACYGCWAY